MKPNLSKYIAIFAVIGFLVPSISFASGGSVFNSFIDVFQNRISEFQKRMEDLRDRIEVYEYEPNENQFNEYLYVGKQGKEVIRLQKFLSQYPDIYPEGVITGYYGQLTKNAVLRFQEKHGISTVGVVGPETRQKLNEIIYNINNSFGTSTESGGGAVMIPNPKAEVEKNARPASENNFTDYSYSLSPRPEYDESEIEESIHEKINDRREQFGLDQLEWHLGAYQVAKNHSEDQADDNEVLVDSRKPCAFPILRHEGFDSGLTVGDRLSSEGVGYEMAGENLVLFPVSNNMIYRYKLSEGKPGTCPSVDQISFSSADSAQEKKKILDYEIKERRSYLENTPTVDWINRQWKSEDEIASQAVQMWMNSAGHRNNMLNPEFEKGGVGVSFAEDFIIITHVLVDN